MQRSGLGLNWDIFNIGVNVIERKDLSLVERFFLENLLKVWVSYSFRTFLASLF